jgi:hypothetical protein
VYVFVHECENPIVESWVGSVVQHDCTAGIASTSELDEGLPFIGGSNDCGPGERVQGEDERRKGSPEESVVLSNLRDDQETQNAGGRLDVWYRHNAVVARREPVEDDDGDDEADFGKQYRNVEPPAELPRSPFVLGLWNRRAPFNIDLGFFVRGTRDAASRFI